MKSTSVFLIPAISLCLSVNLNANELKPDIEVFAERGKGIVTQDDFTARVDRIPEHARKEVLSDRKRVIELLQNLLIASQLSADAREAGFDKEKVIADRMIMAADAELADAWLEHYVEENTTADFEALAYEYYLLNQKTILSSPKVDVTHILISNKERSNTEAKALAETISAKLTEDPSSFDDLVIEYSEDPSAYSNKGKFPNVRKGTMVKPFETAAFALQPGEISGLVKTQYGYHIIRKDADIPPEPLPFEDVKDQVIKMERQKHEERVRAAYLDSLNSLKLEMTNDQVQEMVRRQFGEDYVVPES